jgi:hypothetical protein
MSDPAGPSRTLGPRGSRAAARAARRKQRRRQQQLIAGGVAAALLIGGGGWAAMAAGGDDGGKANEAKHSSDGGDKSDGDLLADSKVLVDPVAANQLSRGKWTVNRTVDSTEAETPERSFACQAQRFADPAGVRTWVRVLRNPNNLDTAVQYVEVSNDATAAGRAYATIAGWLSECNSPQLRLVSSYQASGLGEKGIVAIFGQPMDGGQKRFRTLTVATSGPATMVLEHNTIGPNPPKAANMLAAATTSMGRICAETKSSCGAKPELKSVLLSTDEPRGFMAPIDLPVLSKIDKPWVSVKAATRDGTGCEKIDLKKAKATKSRFQTYVVPDANVPTEFGMDTMVAEFAGYPVAGQFVTDITKRVDNCTKSFSTATVKRTLTIKDRGIVGQTWRITYDAGSNGKLTYRVGIVRVSKRAAYVMFPVLKGLDITDEAFSDLLIRAGERSLYFR